MNRRIPFLILLAALALSACQPAERAEDIVLPPTAEPRHHVVSGPGVDRIDPWYWMRDDSRKDPDVIGWLEAENAYKDAMLAHVETLRLLLVDEMRSRMAEDDTSAPYPDNGYWYYSRVEAGGEYPIFARRKGSMEAAEEILLDVNELAAGQKFLQIGGRDVSPDGSRLAWLQDTVGRRQFDLYIKDLESGEVIETGLSGVDSLSWSADGQSLFYVENEPKTLRSWRVRRHVPGSEGEDELIYQEDDPAFYTGIGRTGSNRYNYVFLVSTVSSEMHIIDSGREDAELKVFLPRERDHEYFADHVDGRWIVRTNLEAPNFRIMQAPESGHQDLANWTDLVPHDPKIFIEDFAAFEDYLAVGERSGGLRRIRILDHASDRAQLIEFDESAYTAYLGINAEPHSSVLEYVYTSLTTPTTVWRLDMASGEQTLIKQNEVHGDFDSEGYISFRTWAEARDGTPVPVTVLHHVDTALDGSAPLYQYGYGSYGASLDPFFNSNLLSLVDRGFVYAIAHVRGGQEMGRDWYEQGRLQSKMNSFTDFIDVTGFLVAEGWIDPERVFAMGGSAGGLLVGAVANMAPERYSGIVAHVPFVDVVSTMLDDSIPLTTNEYDEWGNPNDPESYQYMLSYSPYDNVVEQDYPAMLVTTGLWDSQVQYWEPAKWVAKLRATRTDDRPLLLHTNLDAGHGGQSGRFRRLEQTALEYAFVIDQAGLWP